MSDAPVDVTRRALSLVEMLREGLREHALLLTGGDGKPRAPESMALLGWGRAVMHFPILVVDADDSAPAGTSCWRVAVVCESELELKLLYADVGEFLAGIGRRALLRSGFPEFDLVDDPEVARPKYGGRQLVTRRLVLRSGTPVRICNLCGAKTTGWTQSCTACKGLLNAPGAQTYCPRCARPTLRRSLGKLVSYTEYERTNVYSRDGDFTGYTERPIERTRWEQATVCSVCGWKYPHPYARTKKEYDATVQFETALWIVGIGFVVLLLVYMSCLPKTSNPSGMAPASPPAAVRPPVRPPRPSRPRTSVETPKKQSANEDADGRLGTESRIGALMVAKRQAAEFRLGALAEARRKAADAQDPTRMALLETEYNAAVNEYLSKYGDQAWRRLRTSLTRSESPPTAPPAAAAPAQSQVPQAHRPKVMKRFWRGLKRELTPED